MAGSSGGSAPIENIAAVIETPLIETLFQPIVHLASGHAIGFEALSRGPRGSRIERPDALFAAADRVGLLSELDATCQQLAVRRAADHGLSASLFVNAEPETFARPGAANDIEALTGSGFDLVVEFTERSLADDPATVVAFADRLRSSGCSVALDDVGAHPDSLALLPLLRPDVIKLDMDLFRRPISEATMRVVHAANAEVDRSGCVIVAEGIETVEQRDRALAFGATVGQGWLFGGLSTSLCDHLPRTLHRFDPAHNGSATRRTTKRLLLEMSKQLESTAATLDPPPLVLAAFQESRHFDRTAQRRYSDLAERCSFVGVLGAGIGESPAPGVRGSAIVGDDPLRDEWDVTILSPHFAVALLARDVGDDGPEPDRQFDYVISYDRGVVIEHTSRLMRRIAPLSAR